MYMAPRTPSPITIDLVCEAAAAGIKQTAANGNHNKVNEALHRNSSRFSVRNFMYSCN